MLTRPACSCLAMAAAAFWLVQPGFAQEPSEAVPPELRIIEDLPEATAEGERLISGDEALEERTDEILNAEDEEREPGEEGRIARESGTGSLFEENRSLLYDMPDDSPAEELLPRNVDPDIDLDPRSTGEEDLDPRMTGEASLDPRSNREEAADVPSRQERLLNGAANPQERVASPQDRFEPSGGNSGGGSSGGGSLF